MTNQPWFGIDDGAKMANTSLEKRRVCARINGTEAQLKLNRYQVCMRACVCVWLRAVKLMNDFNHHESNGAKMRKESFCFITVHRQNGLA